MRTNIILECQETKERLYLTSKNKQHNPDKIKLKKYSPRLRRRAWFVEVNK